MNKIILTFLFIFSVSANAQNEDTSIKNTYLTELLSSIQDDSFTSFDTDDAVWRKNAIEKITAKSNVVENSYIKIAMVLHMLNYKLGDAVFFKSIEKYNASLKEKSVAVNLDDFQYYLENESAVELTHFFNDWFKSTGYPSYKINWYQSEITNNINFSVKQIQNNVSSTFFEIPVPVKLIGTNGESQLVRLEVSDNGQSFTGNIPFTVKSIELDPEHHLISSNNIIKAGVDQEILNTEITLYPNPAITTIHIENGSNAILERVSIYDMLGKLVLEETNSMVSINLKSLTAGVHLIKIQTSQGTLHKTILKK